MQGKPVSGVMLNFQPTGDGMPAVIAVDKGAFSGDVIPGKYTYFLSAGKDANAFKKVPEKYQAGATDRQIDITAGTPLNLEMN